MHKLVLHQDAFVMVVMPPPVIGLGTLGGFKLEVEDRTAAGPEALFEALSGGARQGQRRTLRSAEPSAPTRSTCRNSTSMSIATR